MKKLLACILSACLLSVALTGCGGEDTKTIRIYDGTFTGTKIPGFGITAALLEKAGLTIYTELDLPDSLI